MMRSFDLHAKIITFQALTPNMISFAKQVYFLLFFVKVKSYGISYSVLFAIPFMSLIDITYINFIFSKNFIIFDFYDIDSCSISNKSQGQLRQLFNVCHTNHMSKRCFTVYSWFLSINICISEK